jgi:hypothetical protein
MAINNINIGAVANDGTGDPIRTAFDTVNDNFSFVQAGLFAGTEPSIISAVSVTGGYLYSNSYVYATTYVNAGSVVAGTVTSNGNLYVSQQGAYIVGNVSIIGNLSVSGSQLATQTSNSTAPIILIHANAAPYTVNDLKDIGLEWQYYDGADKYGFLGRQNSTGSLVYLDDVVDTANVITSGTFGNVQFGQLLLSNTTSSTSNVTGALQVVGGAGIQGNVFVQSNVFVGNTANVGNLVVRGNVEGSMYFNGGADTIYIGGSPVQTAATAFNGGPIGLPTTFNDTTQSTSAISGAVQIRGGLGVAGNVWVGNLQSNIGGNVRANVQGNIFTAAQPYITSLGTLTGLDVSGQINANDISPNANNTYVLGTGTSDRWSKLWVFDIDMSGTLTGGTVNGTGGTHTGNIAINTATAAALTSTTAVGELFESGPTTIRIGGGGVTQFRNNTKATSTSTGAVVLTGGMAISTGANLYIGGSAGNAIVATGMIWTNNILETSSNTQATSTTTGALQIQGGASLTQGNLYIGGSGGNSIVATGNVGVVGHILPFGANITYNLGSVTQWWNTFYGVSTQARYADLAERYVADSDYSPGTVVVFGGDQEITVTDTFADIRVAGVVSTNPAYLMNAASPGLPIALRGRVPVQVLGAVSKGDLLVTSAQAGFAQSIGQANNFGQAVFAKSLVTDGRNGSKIIEAVII